MLMCSNTCQRRTQSLNAQNQMHNLWDMGPCDYISISKCRKMLISPYLVSSMRILSGPSALKPAMNYNTEQITARLDDTAFNIQQGHPTTWAADNSPYSTSSSPMDDKSTLSKCDYAEYMVA